MGDMNFVMSKLVNSRAEEFLWPTNSTLYEAIWFFLKRKLLFCFCRLSIQVRLLKQWLSVYLSMVISIFMFTLSYTPIKPLLFKSHDTVFKHGVMCTLYASTLKRRSCLWISLTCKKINQHFSKDTGRQNCCEVEGRSW